jgi:hypothetical protein
LTVARPTAPTSPTSPTSRAAGPNPQIGAFKRSTHHVRIVGGANKTGVVFASNVMGFSS